MVMVERERKIVCSQSLSDTHSSEMKQQEMMLVQIEDGMGGLPEEGEPCFGSDVRSDKTDET